MLTAITSNILDFFLPQVCVQCHTRTRGLLCDTCQQQLPWIKHSCQRCGRELIADGPWCGACLQQTPSFACTIAPFSYTAPVSDFIIALKFHGKLLYAKLLSDFLATQLINYYQAHPKPSLIIPVPLHKARLAERGFNQALEIAKPIAKKLKIPLERHNCRRVKNTLAQTLLNADERRINIKKAFVVKKTIPSHIAVIDDVITTGSTINEFCLALRQAGATTIDVWCCARAGCIP